MDVKAKASLEEQINEEVQTPMRKKRKVTRKKKITYVGWASTSLIGFLESIGNDTSKQMTQDDVTEIVYEYVKKKNLFHPLKKNRIVCDGRLRSLFRRKSIARLMVYNMLEPHFAENHEDFSDDLLFFNSVDDEDAFTLATCEKQKIGTSDSERKAESKKVTEKPKSCFAAIVPSNIKLVYMRRSLVEELLKDPENFETKVVGGFVRTKRDPNDYLQKNSHLLLQVTGVKKNSGMNPMNGEILLQVSRFFKDVSIPMLSDDNFNEEECEDLHQRIKDGLLKRPMIVDLEKTARVLHEDMTKHWIAREIILLQKRIDRANEKGWRRDTLDEYLTQREKLQKPDEQARLLHEIPEVIADDLESESMTPDIPDEKVENDLGVLRHTKHTQASLGTEVPKEVAEDFACEATTLDIPDRSKQESDSLKSTLSLSGAPTVPLFNVAVNGSTSNSISHSTGSAEHHCYDIPVQQQQEQQIEIVHKNDDVSKEAESNEAKVSRGLPNEQVLPAQVIELSDHENNAEPTTLKQVPIEQWEYSMIWQDQGPLPMSCQKRWGDPDYFSPYF